MRYLSANQFEVYEQIGKGGFGVVYRGLDRVTKTPVAIKQVDLESTDSFQDLQKEINILSQCHLKQITKYHGCFVKGYKLWIIMEYMDGGSCSDLLRPGPFKEKYIAILLRELLEALAYLHEKDRIHRDVKAANILLNSQGDVKIADFGVSTQLSSNLSRRRTFVGSPYWMSPEVILEEDYNCKADIWSLGITAIELATGKPPLSNIPPMKVLFQIPKHDPPRLEGDDWSPEFKQFVAACLQRNPNKRPSAKRLLKLSKFIQSAGKSSSLKDLIKRQQIWDLEHDDQNRTKYYVPTVELSQRGSSSDKHTLCKANIKFDFGDDPDDSNEKTCTNVSESEVIITKKSPLKKYGVLQENSNVLNMNSISVSNSDSKMVHASRSHISRNSVETALKASIESLDLHDDVQLVKLQQVSFLLQELDDNVLSQFCNNFAQRISASTTSSLRSDGPQHTTTHRRITTTDPARSVSRDRPRGPRKAESEKLLLKRWADQYFA
ncbi:unnamed protein product [Cyberlindnera jadinii]|uniref:non-specific serine/threonine protein kinase n=2 Tax=Cyberlindnera jadinii (strain ATCC 18201 / CBS 1600 / BCRC 20928 / JCM 3617 / NBRC 0987 / NRRL Y-1542) TaxID=983966 RepID=A0A0H5CA76_CYBJN|nr:unnamed protein product [Cyberlindnera jadinii]